MPNQPEELTDYNPFSSHSALIDALARERAASDHDALAALGARLGSSAEMFCRGDAANRNPPVLRVFDRFGARAHSAG
ncbi:MAG TPA: hypothetical protein VGD47_07735 [Steroidobacteraceae bacterium]